MKTLFLLRHAKSSWSNPRLGDQQRPLNNRGKRDAPIMGTRFRARDEILDSIITSPALRAKTTAQLFAEASGFDLENIIEEDELYFSGARSIQGIIRSQDDRCRSVMLVFHNPDITEFANSFDASRRIGNLPTCGLVKLISDSTSWTDWSRSNTSFEYFDYPKNTPI